MPTYHIMAGRVCVLGGGKSGKTIFEDKYSKRITGSYKSINAHIKLETINEKWLQMKKKLNCKA